MTNEFRGLIPSASASSAPPILVEPRNVGIGPLFPELAQGSIRSNLFSLDRRVRWC
jgi:hypothetical protein